MTLAIRTPESIYRAQGPIQNWTFSRRWHFSFGDYYDEKFVNFGALRVFNDDTLSQGDQALSVYGAAMISDQDRIDIAAQEDAELLLVEVML